MCTPDAEKLAISVPEIHEGGYREERSSNCSSDQIHFKEGSLNRN